LGGAVVDADEIAHRLVEGRSTLLEKLAETFGEAIIDADGNLDRLALGDKIFAAPEEKAKLDAIMHPAIREEIKAEIEACRTMGARIIVLDVPLLFEVGWDALTDENWVVYTDEKTQLERLMKRNSFTVEQAENRINSQMPLKEKCERAGFIIDNSKNLSYTKKQVLKRWKEIRKMANE
jgi:dephospho-CoA kinase